MENIDEKKLREWMEEAEMMENSDPANFQRDPPLFDVKYCFYKADGEHKKVDTDNILYLEADDNYVRIYYPGNKYIMVRSTMEALSRELPHDAYELFLISRKHWIVAKYVTAWTDEYVKIGETQLPVSKKYVPLLRERFTILGTY